MGGSTAIAMTRMLGAIKFFSREKGYGFILPDDATGDVFFRHTALQSHPGA